VSLKFLTASPMSDSVLRGMCNCRISLIRSRKSSQFVPWLQSLGGGERRDGCVDSETRTGEWSEESSKQDFVVAMLL
jgi:hypothetical protein